MAQQSGLTGELNFVVSYFWNGCSTPQQLWVNVALPVAGRTALVFLDTDWMDIVTKFYRPKGLKDGRHGRKSSKSRKAQGVPNLLDLISEDVVCLNDPFFGTPTAGTQFLWQLEGFIERVTWTVAVCEISEDFVLQQILGIMQLKATKCDVPGRGFIEGHDFDPFNNGQLYFVPCPDVKYVSYPVVAQAGTLYLDNANYYQILAGITGINRGDTDGDVEFEFWISAPDGGGVYRQPYQTVGGGGSITANFAAIVKGPGFMQWYQRSHGDIWFPHASICAVPSAFTT